MVESLFFPFEYMNGSITSSSGLVQLPSSERRDIRLSLKNESSDHSDGFESEEEGLSSGVVAPLSQYLRCPLSS